MVNIGDITIQDQAVIDPIQRVEDLTRDMTAATGTVAYTGIGFKPSAIIFFANEANDCWSWGLDTVVRKRSTYIQNALAGGSSSNGYSIYLEQAAGAQQLAFVDSFDTDGFTLSWTKVNSPVGSASVKYMAFK